MSIWNCEGTIGLAVASVLDQTYCHWELLVLDDGSTDRTVDVVESFCDSRIKVVCDGERRRLPARLNQAVQMARGEYIARMDGDDVMYPTRLAKQLAYLKANPGVDLLGGGMVVFRNEGEAYGARIFPVEHSEICRRPWLRLPMSHPTWMGRSDWFRRNPYRESAERMEDRDLLFRTFRRSRFANLPDVVLGYREDGVTLAKCVPSRCNMIRMLAHAMGRELSYEESLLGCAAQLVGLTADVVAIGTGLNERVLRHRAPPMSPEIVEDWRSVWRLNRKTVESLAGK